MTTPNRRPTALPDVRAMRTTLLVALAAFAVLLAIVLLMLYTTVLSGTVGGIGTAYIVGFADFLVVLGVAGAYCIQQNRADDRSDAEARGDGR